MASKIGLQVLETDANTSPSIIPSNFNNVGVLFKSERGPINLAISITSIADDSVTFGAARVSEYGGYVKRGLFLNTRNFGAQVYGVRVAGTSGTPALVGSSGNLTCGGLKFVAQTVGTGGNSVNITVATGTNSGTFKLTVQNLPSSPTVTEIFDNLTVATVCDAVNRGLTLGGASGGTGHVDGAPSSLVTLTYAGGTPPANAAIASLTGGSTTAYASLTLSPTVTASVLTSGQLGYDDPGAWANSLSVAFTPQGGAENLRSLAVYRTANGVVSQVELISGISASNMLSKINDPNNGSRFVKVSVAGELPNGDGTLVPLTGGTDGGAPVVADFTGSQSLKTGLYAFDLVDIDLLTCADLTDPTFTSVMNTYAATRKATVVGTATYGVSLATIQSTWSNALLTAKSSTAMYRGWVRVADGFGGQLWVPPVGHIIGACYIRRALSKGIYPNIAPAGLDTALDDVIAVEVPRYNDTDLSNLVRVMGFNPVMYMSGRGFIVRTSRTMSTLPKYYSVHIRRSLNFLSTTLQDSLGWLEQEINIDETRARARQVLRSFFTKLYNASMFDKTGGYDNNIQIKCDDENNPPSVTQARQMQIDIQLRFAEVAETITVNLSSTQNGIISVEN